MASQPPPLTHTPRYKALWSGLINHWFPLIRPAIKPKFLGEGTLEEGDRLISDDSWYLKISSIATTEAIWLHTLSVGFLWRFDHGVEMADIFGEVDHVAWTFELQFVCFFFANGSRPNFYLVPF